MEQAGSSATDESDGGADEVTSHQVADSLGERLASAVGGAAGRVGSERAKPGTAGQHPHDQREQHYRG